MPVSSSGPKILRDDPNAVARAANAQWPLETVKALNAFYGDPRGPNGRVSPKWYADNVILWPPPYPMFYADGKRTPLLHMGCHKKCAPTFTDAFTDVLQTLGHDYIREHWLDVSGGLGNYRLERGGSRLSVHSWYCAIDMDPQHNPFPHKYVGGKQLDQKFVAIMKKHGFFWRGDTAHGDDDPMHLQLCQHVYR